MQGQDSVEHSSKDLNTTSASLQCDSKQSTIYYLLQFLTMLVKKGLLSFHWEKKNIQLKRSGDNLLFWKQRFTNHSQMLCVGNAKQVSGRMIKHYIFKTNVNVTLTEEPKYLILT